MTLMADRRRVRGRLMAAASAAVARAARPRPDVDRRTAAAAARQRSLPPPGPLGAWSTVLLVTFGNDVERPEALKIIGGSGNAAKGANDRRPPLGLRRGLVQDPEC